ncbi:MAG: extracellular solute-binding protein [Alphaproteobacteria bacterium]
MVSRRRRSKESTLVCDTEGAPIIAYNDWIRTTFSDQFLKTIMQDQKPVVFRSTSAAAQALAAGEIDAALCMTPGAIEPLIKQGATAAFTIPKPGFGLVGALGITSWSKRPNAAQVFMNWLMTDEGQNALIAGVGTAASPVGAQASTAIDIKSINAWDASKYDAAKYNQLRGEFTRLLRAR